MGSVRDVVEISSDEEDFLKLSVSPLGWVAKLFDDLVVIGESPVPPQKKGKPDVVGVGEEEDDDDCVVLDGDPHGAITVAGEKGSAGDGSSDELEIVAVKGQLACRDFPHSRHSCSNLPFSTSTSHVKHCSMCYCFVCDAPAPCSYWGKGLSVDDHCHATDKETKWKTLRQAFRCKSIPTSHPEKHQNVVYPTTTSPRQQDIQCQVSLPQSHPSLISNNGRFSVANRSPLPSVARNTSARVSLNAGRTVSAPRVSPATRAGRGTHNAHSTQIIHSVIALDFTDPGAAEGTNPSEPDQQEEDEEYTLEEDDWEETREYVEPPEEATLYVGNLHYDIDSECLAQLFEHAGIVKASEVIYNRETDQSRGFGFVTMRTAEEAEKAVEMFHHCETEGRILTVNKAAPRGALVEKSPCQFGSSPFRIYVGNLPWYVDDSRLAQFFSDYGKVVDVKVVYDYKREAWHSRGFGFVTMATQEEMDFTIAVLNGKILGGRALRVKVANEERRQRNFHRSYKWGCQQACCEG